MKLVNKKRFGSFVTIVAFVIIATIMIAKSNYNSPEVITLNTEVVSSNVSLSTETEEEHFNRLLEYCSETVTPPTKASTPVEVSVNRNSSDISNWIYAGEFKTTGYCGENYPHICNNGDSTYTATMTRPIEGKTIAVDPNVIPYGSKVRINGIEYIAEDCGGAIKGNRIDIFFTSHDRALSYGVQNCEVWIERR